jgi:hypothetical protein
MRICSKDCKIGKPCADNYGGLGQPPCAANIVEPKTQGEESPAQDTMEICHTAPNSASAKAEPDNIAYLRSNECAMHANDCEGY